MKKTVRTGVVKDMEKKEKAKKKLYIDLETRSDEELKDVGARKYAESRQFEVTLFGYAVDDGPVKVVDIASGEKIPEEIIADIKNDGVEKVAHNAEFERVCLSSYLHTIGELDKNVPYLSPKSWRCSKVLAATVALPQSLDKLGEALNISKKKMTAEGQKLIDKFCDYKKAIKPSDCPEDWDTFKEYNKRDVEALVEIWSKLETYDTRPEVWEEYVIDQEINDRGVKVDMELVNKALEMNDKYIIEASARFSKLTGITGAVRSIKKMKEWLLGRGVETADLKKETVEALVETVTDSVVKQALVLYKSLTKSSVKKYETIRKVICADGRVRGMFRFYGAMRTGRFAAVRVQAQNLPKSSMSAVDLDIARKAVRAGDYDKAKELSGGNVPDLLAQLIRTAFIPSEGHKFIVADYSAIEARVLAWLAKEEWRMKAFANGEDIYCASASKMFHKPVVKNGDNGELRAKGKIAELALGYGGSTGSLTNMLAKMGGAEKMGLPYQKQLELVNDWRTANPKIVQFWYDIEKAAFKAVRNNEENTVNGVRIFCSGGFLFVELPSGRKLAYPNAVIKTDEESGKDGIYYTDFSNGKCVVDDTYGGSLVENITQATARDLLCYAMKNLTDKGYEIVVHVHDEVVVDAPHDASVETVCDLMAEAPAWADGLPLHAEGFESDYYRKD